MKYLYVVCFLFLSACGERMVDCGPGKFQGRARSAYTGRHGTDLTTLTGEHISYSPSVQCEIRTVQ